MQTGSINPCLQDVSVDRAVLARAGNHSPVVKHMPRVRSGRLSFLVGSARARTVLRAIQPRHQVDEELRLRTERLVERTGMPVMLKRPEERELQLRDCLKRHLAFEKSSNPPISYPRELLR